MNPDPDPYSTFVVGLKGLIYDAWAANSSMSSIEAEHVFAIGTLALAMAFHDDRPNINPDDLWAHEAHEPRPDDEPPSHANDCRAIIMRARFYRKLADLIGHPIEVPQPDHTFTEARLYELRDILNGIIAEMADTGDEMLEECSCNFYDRFNADRG